MKICLNPGHFGDIEPGATGYLDGKLFKESHITKEIVDKLEKKLSVEHEVEVVQFNDLGKICRESNKFKADIFISIHCNAHDSNATGFETFRCRGTGFEGKLLQAKIHNEMAYFHNKYPLLSLSDRGKKTAGYYVIRKTNCPAILIETGFMSNSRDLSIISHQDYQKHLVIAIRDGLFLYEKDMNGEL